MSDSTTGVLEKHTIEAIPAEERHGRPRDLFTIWFSANLGPLTVVTGVLAPTVFGLSFSWSMAALLVGHLGGGFLMALHSAQGPQLGVPQMIQSRGQFGSVGALVAIAVVLVMYVGLFSSNLVVGAQSLHQVVPVVPIGGGTVLCAVVSLAVCVVGYRLMHRIGAVTTWVFGAVQIAAVVVMFAGGLPAGFLQHGGFSVGGFLGMVSVGALWQIAYAPYVSDYSRYMPADRAGVRSTLWCTYAGCVIGSILPMVVGVVIGISYAGDDPIAAQSRLLGAPVGQITLWSYALVTMLTNSMNLYGTVLCAVTAVQTFAHRWLPRPSGRAVVATLFSALSVALAVALAGDFLNSYLNLIYVLQYVLIPWTAINLVDFYLVRHGAYDVPSFFSRDGGVYGRWDATALTVYALGILVEIPFMAQTMYTGPVARALGDTDLGWIAGLVFTVPVYLYAARRRTRRAARGAREVPVPSGMADVGAAPVGAADAPVDP